MNFFIPPHRPSDDGSTVRKLSSRTLLVVTAAMSLLGSLPASAAYNDPALSIKTISSATNTNQPILTFNPSAATTVTLQAAATNFTPTSYSWSQVPETLNSFAAPLTAAFSASTTSAPQVTVTLPAAGIYQFAVTATDGTNTATVHTWVNVWDNRPAISPTGVVGKNPGINPPTSVRQLSPDPGPYCHPRVLFARADWPDFNDRSTNSTEAASAMVTLNAGLTGGFDKMGTTMYTLAADLVTYAQGGYADSYRTGTLATAYAAAPTPDTVLGANNPTNAFYSSLLSACYVAWVGTDPTLAHSSVPTAQQNRFNYLATVTAAAAHYELLANHVGTNNAIDKSKLPDNLALCYDLIYDWMTAQQQSDTRDYLYALSYDVYNTFGGGLGGYPGPVPSGSHMNGGDFPNLVDGIILPELAIEGEEASVTPAVQAANFPLVPAATGPGAWPNSSPASVSNLERQIRYLSEWAVTPWGFVLNVVDYFQLGENFASPGTLGYARRAENGWVTTNLYQSSLAALYNFAHREDNKGPAMNSTDNSTGVGMFDHHDGQSFGNGLNADAEMYLAKYMYPDDPMVDYVYRVYRNDGSQPLAQAMFGLTPGTAKLSVVAQAKGLALTKFDPLRATAASRNTWDQDDLNLTFENRFDSDGHQHAEHNSFSLYALGRVWSNAPGYHCTINDLMATVLIQDPDYTSDPATQGYIGQGPASAPIAAGAANQPSNNSPPGRLLEISEEPNQLWTVFAGDATSEYTYRNGGSATLDTGVPADYYPYPGLEDDLLDSDLGPYRDGDLVVAGTFNTVQYALRSVLTVRGANPYVLVLDDIQKDTATHNYRWSMSNGIDFGPTTFFVDASGNGIFSSMAISPGATPTDATLYHLKDVGTDSPQPRLLVRDVSEQNNAGQPAVFLDQRPNGYAGGNLTYGIDNNSKKPSLVSSSRVMIERDNVVSPAYKVLLFPYLTGTTLPTTSWNANHTVLTVSGSDGTVDQITMDGTRADHRTRVTAFSRSTGTGAPTLTLPSSFTVAATSTLSDGSPAGVATYTATAKDATGAALTPKANFPSGTLLPVGVNTVVVSALDSKGQERTASFTVTVSPASPQVSVTSISNVGASPYGVSLSWPVLPGVTGYHVKRATSAGGTYTTLATITNPYDTTYTDNTATTTGYFYAVTALVNTAESANSNIIALAPATTNLTGQGIGLTSQGGVYQMGSTYLVSCQSGNLGGSSDSVAFLGKAWTGDGVFSARVASLYSLGSNVSSYANFGVAFRADATNKAVESIANYALHPPTYVSFVNRTATGGSTASSGEFDNVGAPLWLRLTRAGSNFTASLSEDGVHYTAAAPALSLTNMPATGLVGLAVGPSSGPTANVLFDDVVFVGTPTVTQANGSVTLNWAGSFGATSYRLGRSTSAAGPFSLIASGLTGTSYTDIPPGGTTYYYSLMADDGVDAPSATAAAITVSLASPTGVAITPGSGQNQLAWTAVSGATGYHVKRATTSGGPYTTVASPTSASYTDPSLTNGTAYYYVVSATGAGQESANSFQQSGTPGTVPGALQPMDIGAVGLTGSTSYSNGTYTLKGSGADIWSTADSFQFAGRPITGDMTMIVQVASQSANPKSKSGLIIRESTAANAPYVNLMIQQATATRMQERTGTGINAMDVGGNSNGNTPYWLRLVRAGNVFTGSVSTDGVTWTQVGQTTVAMNAGVVAGMGECAVNNTILATGTFTNFSLVALPSPWQTADLGSVAAAGSAVDTAGVFVVTGSGADVYNTADAFRYVWQAASGNCTVTARVVDLQDTNPYAKVGVMIRETLNANSTEAAVFLTPINGTEFDERYGTGASTTVLGHGDRRSAPYWVRLTRAGSQFTAYNSPDGVNWSVIGSPVAVSMSTNVYIGLAVCSHADGVLNTAVFDQVTVSP